MATWQLLDSATEVAEKTVELIGQAAKSAINERDVFSLVLAGGSTPLAAYELLARQQQQWGKWQLYYGDERCLPVGDSERNSQMVINSGLTRDISQHFPIAGELGNQIAAKQYEACIHSAMPFDMVLLGMGEDGHTASLFPNLPWPETEVAAVSGSPKPPSDRVTLSATALQNSRKMLVLITGSNKQEAVNAWLGNKTLPVSRVCNVEHCTVLIEKSLMDDGT